MTEVMAKAPVRVITDNKELQRKLLALAPVLGEPELTRANTALMVIDVQYMDAHRDYGVGAKAKKMGLTDVVDYYFDRLENLVIPNIQRLQVTARRKGVELIHIRVASATRDGRDASARFRTGGFETPTHTKEAEILPEVGPYEGELVVNKTTESVFNSTNMDRMLRNMGISNLIITGVVTNGCVEGTTRGAAENNYGAILVEDATATFAPQLQEHSVLSMSLKDALIRSTDEVIQTLESL